jgi:hypothetical protein
MLQFERIVSLPIFANSMFAWSLACAAASCGNSDTPAAPKRGAALSRADPLEKGRVGRMSNIVIYEGNDLMRGLLEEWLSEAGCRKTLDPPRSAGGGARYQRCAWLNTHTPMPTPRLILERDVPACGGGSPSRTRRSLAERSRYGKHSTS